MVQIELREFKHFDDQEQVDDDYCNVGLVGGTAVEVELLCPARHLDLLGVAAERYGLDGTALVAAAQAALAAPDHAVELQVGSRVAA